MLIGLGSFDTSQKYYLAGPMSGYEDYNYPAFEKAAHELRESGITILSPHEVPRPKGTESLTEPELWTVMMEATDRLVTQSEGIILLKGWPSSRGARIELTYFLDHSMPVYFYDAYTLIDMNRSR